MSLVSLHNINIAFGGPLLLENVSLDIQKGQRICFLGRNGVGKSTFMKIIAGEISPDSGDSIVAPGVRIAYLSQEVPVGIAGSVFEIVAGGAGMAGSNLALLHRLVALHGDSEQIADLHHYLDQHDGWQIQTDVERVLDQTGLSGAADFKTLSGGLRRRVMLARALVQDPALLLLDEPTNHLDTESVAWLEHHLQAYAGTVIAVTHDRYFLDNVAGWILELDRGQGIPWKGNYSSWLEQKRNRLQKEEKTESERQKTLQRELEWIRMSPKGRHAKSKARISSYENLLSQEMDARAKELEIYIPPGPRLGKLVIEAEGVGKAYGDRLLVEKMSFNLPPGGIVGIIGPNGAGKTTLFRMITGQEKPDSGTIRIADTVKLAYVDQSRDVLDPDKTIWETIAEGRDIVLLGNREVNSRAYVSRFNFSGTDQQKKVSQISGGERNRVHLARMLKEGANVLLLDEPTNDLDVNTMRALEEALENFAGCAVVISHDRWFLDRIATHILAFEGESTTVWFEGNYSEYEADRKARLGAAASQPHRIKYRQLTRI